MFKNIFLKSALRQPIRSILLALLVGIAAFAFVARVVEYMVVTGEIARIEERYRSVGFLQHPDFVPTPPRLGQILLPEVDVNAYPAAGIIDQNPHVLFGDRRRFVQGELPVGMTNANFNTFGELIGGRTRNPLRLLLWCV
ncbi:MAG: hypothetical protein FWC96_07965 [Oscillospiraceae bacterium]|nr:hypothetical protein [Oscillospiraceae bacterium]